MPGLHLALARGGRRCGYGRGRRRRCRRTSSRYGPWRGVRVRKKPLRRLRPRVGGTDTDPAPALQHLARRRRRIAEGTAGHGCGHGHGDRGRDRANSTGWRRNGGTRRGRCAPLHAMNPAADGLDHQPPRPPAWPGPGGGRTAGRAPGAGCRLRRRAGERGAGAGRGRGSPASMPPPPRSAAARAHAAAAGLAITYREGMPETCWPTAAARFDAVLALEVIEHVRRPGRLLPAPGRAGGAGRAGLPLHPEPHAAVLPDGQARRRIPAAAAAGRHA